LLGTSRCTSGTLPLWRLCLLRAAGTIVPLRQTSIDFFSAQVVEGWIKQGSCRQREPIGDQQWIDGQVCGFIPEAGIALASAAMMSQSAVHDFMSQHGFEFCRLK